MTCSEAHELLKKHFATEAKCCISCHSEDHSDCNNFLVPCCKVNNLLNEVGVDGDDSIEEAIAKLEG